jgi:hypothetical protein
MKSLRFRLGALWCKSMHPAPMWPVHGHYQCPTCLRSYPVPWEEHSPPPACARSVARPRALEGRFLSSDMDELVFGGRDTTTVRPTVAVASR